MWFKLLVLWENIKSYALFGFFAARHPKTPRFIKRLLLLACFYLFSPIDFVPDYMPVVGFLDDALLLPTAFYFLTNLLPPDVRRDCEYDALRAKRKLPYVFAVAVLFSVLWLCFIVWVMYRAFFR